MPHIILLGDSIFDNSRYVPGQPNVVRTLETMLPLGWSATLLARDGAVTSDVSLQMALIPKDATHLVVSVGGNDALGYRSRLRGPAGTLDAALESLAEIQNAFRDEYAEMMGRLVGLNRALLVCTVYDAIPGLSDGDRAGLSLFNDVIVREAAARRIDVLDLRSVCNKATDYSSISPIEPSHAGGVKIAEAICRATGIQDLESRSSTMFV